MTHPKVGDSVGLLFQVAPRQLATAPPAHVVDSLESAYKIYVRTGAALTKDAFVNNLCSYDAQTGRPGDPIRGILPAKGQFFCIPILVRTSAANAAPLPIITANGPYPKPLIAFAIKHRPVFSLPDGITLSNASILLSNAGYPDAKSLYESNPSPVSVPLVKAEREQAVYVHIIVCPSISVCRAFVQYYVLLQSAEQQPRARWNVFQIECVKPPNQDHYVAVTSGCSTASGGEVLYYEQKSVQICRDAGIHYRAPGPAEFQPLQGGRPLVYIDACNLALALRLGNWTNGLEGSQPNPVRTPDSGSQVSFDRYYERVAPVTIKAGQSWEPRESSVIFLLTSEQSRVYWLGWPGQFGMDDTATKGPRYLGPRDTLGRIQRRLCPWGFPETFQEMYFSHAFKPRRTRLVTCLINVLGLSFIDDDVALPQSADSVIYVPLTVVARAAELVSIVRLTSELPIARATPSRDAPAALLISAPFERNARAFWAGAVYQLTLDDWAELLRRLAGPSIDDWVALQLHIPRSMVLGLPGGDGNTFDVLGQGRPVIQMTSIEKVQEALLGAIPLLDDEAGRLLSELFTKENVQLTIGFIALAIAAQGTAVGWALDVLLLGWTAYQLGMQGLDGLHRIAQGIAMASLATTEAELKVASEFLAAGLTMVTVAAFVTWLLRRQPRRIWSNRPRLKRAAPSTSPLIENAPILESGAGIAESNAIAESTASSTGTVIESAPRAEVSGIPGPILSGQPEIVAKPPPVSIAAPLQRKISPMGLDPHLYRQMYRPMLRNLAIASKDLTRKLQQHSQWGFFPQPRGPVSQHLELATMIVDEILNHPQSVSRVRWTSKKSFYRKAPADIGASSNKGLQKIVLEIVHPDGRALRFEKLQRGRRMQLFGERDFKFDTLLDPPAPAIAGWLRPLIESLDDLHLQAQAKAAKPNSHFAGLDLSTPQAGRQLLYDIMKNGEVGHNPPRGSSLPPASDIVDSLGRGFRFSGKNNQFKFEGFLEKSEAIYLIH